MCTHFLLIVFLNVRKFFHNHSSREKIPRRTYLASLTRSNMLTHIFRFRESFRERNPEWNTRISRSMPFQYLSSLRNEAEPRLDTNTPLEQ